MAVLLAVTQVPQRKGRSLPAAFLLSCSPIAWCIIRYTVVPKNFKINAIPGGKYSDSRPGLDVNPVPTPW
jgi:hypothetical protein